MGFRKTIADTSYRIRVRKALSNATTEQIQITLEESKKMLEIRRKKKC